MIGDGAGHESCTTPLSRVLCVAARGCVHGRSCELWLIVGRFGHIKSWRISISTQCQVADDECWNDKRCVSRANESR